MKTVFLLVTLCLSPALPAAALSHKEEMARYPKALQQRYHKAITAAQGQTPGNATALKTLRQFTTARRYPSRIAFLLGLSHYERKEFAQAEQWFRQAVRINPANGGNNALLAITLVIQNKLEPAIPFARTALQDKNLLPEMRTVCNRILSHTDFIANFIAWGKGAHGIVVSLFILFTSIILHEIAHGWMALRMGDPTARDAGRLNPNPLVHVDPFGSLFLPLILVITGASTVFGWAKPVPVNPDNYRNRKKGDILVSLAGPVTNLLLAVSGILLLKILPNTQGALFLQYFGLQLMLTNTVLVTLNLLPIPPLDGSHVVANILPQAWADNYRKLGIVGMFLVFLLLNTAVFGELVGTAIRGMISLFGVKIG